MNSLRYRKQATQLLFLTLFGFLAVGPLLAQPASEKPAPATVEWDPDSPYYRVMAEHLTRLDSMESPEKDIDQIAAALQRVARVETDKALPLYYLAFVYTTKAFWEKDLDEIDAWCDRSANALAQVETLGGVAPEEVLVIRALIQYGRLQVDFMGRGLEASQEAERCLFKAYKINPENPRVLAMLSQHYLRIPAQVGGSREKACEFAVLAIEAFETEKASFPADIFPIVPHWGEYDIIEVAGKYCYYKKETSKTKARE